MELMKYITASKNAVNKGYQGLEKALMTYDEALETLHQKADTMTEQAVNDEHRALNEQLDAAIIAARDQMNAEIAKQRDGFTAEVTEHYRPDGAKIDQNDAAVLNAGFPLRDDEVFDLIVKHQDNNTMLRSIYAYIKQNRMVGRVPTRLIRACMRAEQGGEAETKVFERFIHLATMGFAHPDKNYTFYQAALDDYETDAELHLLKAVPYASAEVQAKIDQIEREQMQKRNDTRAKRNAFLSD